MCQLLTRPWGHETNLGSALTDLLDLVGKLSPSLPAHSLLLPLFLPLAPFLPLSGLQSSPLAPMGKVAARFANCTFFAWFTLQSSAWFLLFLKRFVCISHLAEEHRMIKIMGSPGGQGENVACRARTQLGVSQHLGCSEMTKALERKENTDCGVSS